MVSTYLSEKYDFVSWDYDIPNVWKNRTCSKPPTSYICDDKQPSLECRNNIDHKSSTAQLWNTNSMDICLQISFLRRLLDASSVHISASAERQARFGSNLSYKMESMLSSRIKYYLITSLSTILPLRNHIFSLPIKPFSYHSMAPRTSVFRSSHGHPQTGLVKCEMMIVS